jgi:hypothetical protein
MLNVWSSGETSPSARYVSDANVVGRNDCIFGTEIASLNNFLKSTFLIIKIIILFKMNICVHKVAIIYSTYFKHT